MNFTDDFFKEETLWGHLVTQQVKKVWAVEICILEEFDRICKKHGLKYYAGFGTLLGLVRHHGFIPWDDDIDVAMMRPDYEKMKLIIKDELSAPYEFQDEQCPFQLRTFCKIRDPRTTGIEFTDAPEDFNQGLFIDIFPLDDACNSADDINPNWEMKKELWCALSNPSQMQDILSRENHLLLPPDILKFVMTDQTGQGLQLFNSFCTQHFGETDKVELIVHDFNRPGNGIRRRCFEDTIYIPFHGFNMPAPIGYEEILTRQFTSYMTPVKFASLHNGMITDPDRPYREVLAELNSNYTKF